MCLITIYNYYTFCLLELTDPHTKGILHFKKSTLDRTPK
jgi:hypothetical protein